MERNCMECGEKVLGRIDKKFCSDLCRNAYNNKLNSDANNLVRNINHALRKNRKILAALNKDGKTKLPREKLTTKGFDFTYFTNLYTTKKGATYYFCYDQGYLPISDDWVMLVVKQSYLE